MKRLRGILTRDRVMSDKGGFTLIELLVVMVILGLLAALVGPRVFSKVGKGKQAAAKTQIELLSQGIEQFKVDTGRFPSNEEGLEALRTNPGADGWDGPYLKKKVPLDPWKQPYHYVYPGTNGDYDIFSYGADNKEGGDGDNKDINSWE
ncbi:type II secretion system major pseudopilin GspG [Candidatus Magnetobacterium casense]|uniref:type II secretion system major pseudopilin GspG n=1 Tax=Candidatus Magnetobacterium casense TaxID=1455061 RepID=UPI00190F48EF|nr:type II secretion system major pseudopilin GspG [Candidatus Magnetobacterium casensis]